MKNLSFTLENGCNLSELIDSLDKAFGSETKERWITVLNAIWEQGRKDGAFAMQKAYENEQAGLCRQEEVHTPDGPSPENGYDDPITSPFTDEEVQKYAAQVRDIVDRSTVKAKEYVAAISKTEPTTTLYRPVGQKELDLIKESDYKVFPPQLFHPVLSEAYAIQIAQWHTTNHKTIFYVLQFEVKSSHLKRYEIHQVGNKNTQEYWISANQLDVFNDNIVGKIRIIHAFSDFKE